MTDPASYTDIITQLGPSAALAAFAMFILWKMAIMFVDREREKDASHLKERTEWAQRMDKREETVRTLESDIRNNFATTIQENSNTMKRAMQLLGELSKKRV